MKALTAKMTRQLEAQLKAQRAAMLEAVRAELLRGDQQSYATIAGEMRDLDDALVRLKRDPYFGICVECGDDIGIQRLMAFPTATRCVTCQGQREKTYAHGAIPTL
jgi:DnaK suppressor protein